MSESFKTWLGVEMSDRNLPDYLKYKEFRGESDKLGCSLELLERIGLNNFWVCYIRARLGVPSKLEGIGDDLDRHKARKKALSDYHRKLGILRGLLIEGHPKEVLSEKPTEPMMSLQETLQSKISEYNAWQGSSEWQLEFRSHNLPALYLNVSKYTFSYYLGYFEESVQGTLSFIDCANRRQTILKEDLLDIRTKLSSLTERTIKNHWGALKHLEVRGI